MGACGSSRFARWFGDGWTIWRPEKFPKAGNFRESPGMTIPALSFARTIPQAAGTIEVKWC
jgi:hypothetical protein